MILQISQMKIGPAQPHLPTLYFSFMSYWLWCQCNYITCSIWQLPGFIHSTGTKLGWKWFFLTVYETLYDRHLNYRHVYLLSLLSLPPVLPFIFPFLLFTFTFTALRVLKSWICRGRKNGTSVESTDCSSRGLWFNSQNPWWLTTIMVTPVPGHLTLSSGQKYTDIIIIFRKSIHMNK